MLRNGIWLLIMVLLFVVISGFVLVIVVSVELLVHSSAAPEIIRSVLIEILIIASRVVRIV